MILISPVASGARIVLGRAAFLGYPVDMFMNTSKIGAVTCATVVVHGTKDDVVPVEHGEMIHSMLQNPFPPLWLEGAGHNDIEYHYGRELIAVMKEFVAHVKLRPYEDKPTKPDIESSTSQSVQREAGCIASSIDHRNCL